MKKAIFFDLDGTLLQMSQKQFEHEYFKKITIKFAKLGYDAELFQKAMWAGINAMWTNPGEKTNETLFWETLGNIFNVEDVEKLKPIFEDYYFNEYNQIEEIVTKDPNIKPILDWCKQNFEYVVLATNPFFPTFGTNNRLGWIGLSLQDFDYVTTYENSRYSKPDPRYFEDLMSKFNLKPEECIMVGNNQLEDFIIAKQVGMDALLVGEFVLPYDKAPQPAQVIKLENLIDVLAELKNK